MSAEGKEERGSESVERSFRYVAQNRGCKAGMQMERVASGVGEVIRGRNVNRGRWNETDGTLAELEFSPLLSSIPRRRIVARLREIFSARRP